MSNGRKEGNEWMMIMTMGTLYALHCVWSPLSEEKKHSRNTITIIKCSL